MGLNSDPQRFRRKKVQHPSVEVMGTKNHMMVALSFFGSVEYKAQDAPDVATLLEEAAAVIREVHEDEEWGDG